MQHIAAASQFNGSLVLFFITSWEGSSLTTGCYSLASPLCSVECAQTFAASSASTGFRLTGKPELSLHYFHHTTPNLDNSVDNPITPAQSRPLVLRNKS